MPIGVYIRKPRSEEHKKLQSEGLKLAYKSGKKKSWNKGLSEEKFNFWKGDNAGKDAMHAWVRKWKGTPKICVNCGIFVGNPMEIHWANIDHKYRRVLEDYIRLCRWCHDKYDNLKGFRKKINKRS